MPNAIWIIETNPPAHAIELCLGFLPNGTRLELRTEGPTRLAIEEDRRDELGGSLKLLPPLTPALCRTGLGKETGFGTNLCKNGEPQSPALFDDAVFIFHRLSAADVADPDNTFFVSRGAGRNARILDLFIRYKSAHWKLWLKSANEMVSECFASFPGKNNIESFPMIWRRQQ